MATGKDISVSDSQIPHSQILPQKELVYKVHLLHQFLGRTNHSESKNQQPKNSDSVVSV